jgi:glycosyltransferase involved in cell wall biosynthesis
MKVLVITNMYPEPSRPAWGAFVKSQVDALRAEGVEIDILVIRGGRTKISYLVAMIKMYLRLKHEQYDLIHAHYGLCGLVACAQSSCPVVVSFCGDDLYGHSDANGNASYTSLFWVWLHLKLVKRIEGVIVKSSAMADLIPEIKANVIPNGVFMDIFKPLDKTASRMKLNMDKDSMYVLFPYSKINARKNYPLVEEAVKLLQTKNGMDIRIVVVDNADHTEMATYMNAADVFVLTSFWEGSPNVVKEALSCDMKVVSVNVGDVAELIEGVPGCCLVDRNVIAVSEGIKSVLEITSSVGMRRAAVTHLAAPIVARQVISVYEKALHSWNQNIK